MVIRTKYSTVGFMDRVSISGGRTLPKISLKVTPAYTINPYT